MKPTNSQKPVLILFSEIRGKNDLYELNITRMKIEYNTKTINGLKPILAKYLKINKPFKNKYKPICNEKYFLIDK